MQAFDNHDLEKYKAEAQEKWGKTEAYGEYTEKTKHHGKQQWNLLVGKMDLILE